MKIIVRALAAAILSAAASASFAQVTATGSAGTVDAPSQVTALEKSGMWQIYVSVKAFQNGSVTYETTGGPYAGLRYPASSGHTSFHGGSGETSFFLKGGLVNDEVHKGGFSFTVHLTVSGSGITFTNGATSWDTRVDVIEDDLPAVIEFAQTFPATVPEAIGTYNVEVRRSGDLANIIGVVYHVTPGSEGELTFHVNEMSQTIAIPIPNDDIWQPREYAIELSNATFDAILGGGDPRDKVRRVSFTVQDDDPRPEEFGIPSASFPAWSTGQMEVRIGRPATAATSVALRSSDSAVVTVPESVSIAAGSSRASFAVAAGDPGAAKVNATLPVSAGGATYHGDVTIYLAGVVTAPRDVTLLSGSNAAVEVELAPPPKRSVAIPLASSSGRINVPAVVVIEPTGRGTFSIAAGTPGDAVITIAQPSSAATADTRIDVHVDVTPGGLAVTSVAPAAGPAAGGTTILITGANFSPGCTVLFGKVAATNIAFTSATSLTAVSPRHSGGTTNVTVSCAGRDAMLPDAFTFRASAPQMTAVVPSTGSIAGGTLVAINGTNLRSSCGVFVGGVHVPIVADRSPDALVVTAPAHGKTEFVDVTLQCGSDSVTAPNSFAYTPYPDPAPVITAVAPQHAYPGQVVTLTGAHFRVSDDLRVNDIKIVPASITPGEVTFVVPPVDFVANVTLRDTDTHVLTGPFFYVLRDTPQIGAVTPARIAPGAELTITGKNFGEPYRFMLGNTSAGTVIEQSYDHAVVRLDSGVASGIYPLSIRNGALDLVTTPVATGPNVEIGGMLTVSGVTPPCSSGAGGVPVMLTGSGFTTGTRVFFGDAESESVTLLSSSLLEALTPESHLGNANLRVTTPNGETATLTRAFWFYSPFDGGCTPLSRTRGVRH